MSNPGNNHLCSSCGRAFTPGVCPSPEYCANYCEEDRREVHQRVCALLAAEHDLSSPAHAPPPPEHLSFCVLSLADDQPPPDPASSTSTSAAAAAPAPALSVHLSEPFHRLSVRDWLYNRPEHDVFRLLIDVYRLRMADQFQTSPDGTDVDDDCVWNVGTNSSIGGFTRFLFRIYNTAPDLLPTWWSLDAHVRCREYGMPTTITRTSKKGKERATDTATAPWQDLRRMVGRQDVARFYRDTTMPTQMAIFAAAVYGSGTGGVSTEKMLKLWVNVEVAERGRLEGPFFDRTEGAV